MFTRKVRKKKSMLNIYLNLYGFFYRSDAEVAYARVLAKNSDALQKMASRTKGYIRSFCNFFDDNIFI
jgi:hypothetical protein